MPNEHGDWTSHRNSSFETFIPVDAEKKFDPKSKSYFVMHSLGINTSRDAWCYNFSTQKLGEQIGNTIEFYNEQLLTYKAAKERQPDLEPDGFAQSNQGRISWDRGLKNDLANCKSLAFDANNIYQSLYRPFSKQRLYFDSSLNAMLYQNRKLFPTRDTSNIIICLSSVGSTKGLSVLITNSMANLHFNGDTQCFPLYYYETREKSQQSLFDATAKTEYIRRDGVSDFIFERARKMYGPSVGKEDIFYYVYGILHSPTYRITFAADLKKMLPRVPLVEEPRDFWKFSKAGRKLAELHIGYESVPPYEGVVVTGDDSEHYRIEKMRFPKKGEKDSIIYNSRITISNIPAEAYEYVMNGKSAVEWIMERYQITTHKESGITNDPNDWAEEVGNPRYILDLLLSVINVSVQTVDIVATLPSLSFANEAQTAEAPNDLAEDETLSLDPNLYNNMPEYSLDEGLYTIQQAAVITRFSTRQIAAWFDELHKEGYEGLKTVKGERKISFYGVVELTVIGAMRLAGVKLKKILEARRVLTEKIHELEGIRKVYAFATNRVDGKLSVSGKDIIFEFPDGSLMTLDGTSQLNLRFIKLFFADIKYNKEGLAEMLRPKSGNELIVITPKKGAGKAIIERNERPVAVVSNMMKRGYTWAEICDQCGVENNEIEAVDSYEKREPNLPIDQDADSEVAEA